MPRKSLYRTAHWPYHVTNRSNNKEWFYIPMNQVWDVFQYYLGEVSRRYGSEIHTFVLMSNHYHLMVSTPDLNLAEGMRYLQTEVAKAIQIRAERINHIFGNRYRWSVLEGAVAIAFAYKYILRNPVRAGMCHRVEDYQFSACPTVSQAESCPLTCGIGPNWRFIPKEQHSQLSWLNEPSTKETDELVGKTLRRYQFAFSRGNEVRGLVERTHAVYQIPTVAPGTFSAEKSIGTYS